MKVKDFFKDTLLKPFKTINLENREKWLKNTLLNIPNGSRILDAGGGELQYKRFCEHLNYVSQDFAHYDGIGDCVGLQMGEWDNTKIDIVCDITNIPKPDSFFDAIMCIEVFEHLPSPIEALREFFRLLRPKGYLILTAPFASLTHFAPFHFYSGFNRYFYEKWLKEIGFNIIELSPNGNYFDFLMQEIWRLNFMSKRFTSKSKSLNLVENLCLFGTLKILKHLSANDLNSNEILCFGYNVLAQKTN